MLDMDPTCLKWKLRNHFLSHTSAIGRNLLQNINQPPTSIFSYGITSFHRISSSTGEMCGIKLVARKKMHSFALYGIK